MSNVKKFEEFNPDYFDSEQEEEMSEEEFIRTPQYFVETYHNGQFSQLKRLLDGVDREDLLDYLNEIEAWEIKDWLIINL